MPNKELLSLIKETQTDLAEAKTKSDERAKVINDLIKQSDETYNRMDVRLSLIVDIVKSRYGLA